MTSPTHHSETFGRQVRVGSLQEQVVPTYTLIQEAIEAGTFDIALELIEYCDLEGAGLCLGFYEGFASSAEGFLQKEGIAETEFAETKRYLLLLINEPWEPGRPYDRLAAIERYRREKALLIATLGVDRKVSLRALHTWKETWRSIHDRDVDYVYGLISVAGRRLGEVSLEALFRFVLEERFAFRYARFDVSKLPWEEAFELLLYVSIESMRGHLAGPDRDGAMQVREFDDRVELTFAPCGSGGRALQGDRITGSPPRDEAPYNFLVLKEAHPFAWSKKGVCGYCAHCAMLMERMPMERFGYPVRVLDPPTHPGNDAFCRWTMYRDPRSIPEAAYQRFGMQKPGPDVPLGSASREARDNGRQRS